MIADFALKFLTSFRLAVAEQYRAQLAAHLGKPVEGETAHMAGACVAAALAGKPSKFQIDFHQRLMFESARDGWADKLIYCFQPGVKLTVGITHADDYPATHEIESAIERLDIIQLEFWRKFLPFADGDSEALRHYKIQASLKFLGVLE